MWILLIACAVLWAECENIHLHLFAPLTGEIALDFRPQIAHKSIPYQSEMESRYSLPLTAKIDELAFNSSHHCQDSFSNKTVNIF